MTDSPHEYIEELREQNKILRANVVQLCREKRVLEETIASLSAEMMFLKRRFNVAPHDYEPARPGLSDVD